MAVSFFNFEHKNKYMEEPFTVNRGDKIFYMVAPYSAKGVISSEPVVEFRGDDLKEDHYEARGIESIEVYIGDVEKISDDQGNPYDPEKFPITSQDENQMEREVIDFYYEWV